MDKDPQSTGKQANRWAWLPSQMPGVAKLLAEQRALVGNAHVNECWKRGVLQSEPGWFWASEGALMVGTLWEDAEILAFAQARVSRTQALLILRPVGEPTP